MTVEVKAESVEVIEEPVKVVEETNCEKHDDSPFESSMVEKSSSYREESNILSDLKDHERKALNELKTKLEDAIVGNTMFKKEQKKESDCKKPKGEEAKESEEESKAKKDDDGIEENTKECEKIEETDQKPEPEIEVVVDQDISIWGVPLLPCKADEGTSVILLKFLRAREFRVNDAFEMLVKTLLWRKEFNIDSIVDEEFETDLSSAAYMSGVDRKGRPICYNIFGVLDSEDVYEKTLATEEKRERFVRWRVQLMEKGVRMLDLKPEGVNSLVQVNDLKNSLGPAKKEVRAVVNKAVSLLQDNYPEFVAKNIFINVPFWYFAFHSLLSPFLTQRTRSKLVVARPSKVTETLLKYIPIQEIPIQYGGIKRENDYEFSATDGEALEILIKAGSTETIEIPTPEDGTTFIWDLIVLGWDVNYREEFVPTDENSYTMIIHKGKKMNSDEEPVRRTFKNPEQGKIVLTVENCSGKKKKVFYRYKVKKACL